MYVKGSTFVNEHIDNATEGDLIHITAGLERRQQKEPLTLTCNHKNGPSPVLRGASLRRLIKSFTREGILPRQLALKDARHRARVLLKDTGLNVKT